MIALPLPSSPTKDVLEWLRDWGNTFNKAAAKPSFIEHLRVLNDKIEPALTKHLAEDFKPAMTASHPEYEKTVKAFLDTFFPGRFKSFREYQPAQAFRTKMMDYDLWDWFVEWCNKTVDFKKLSDNMDNGTIYKILNFIARKLLVHVIVEDDASEFKAGDEETAQEGHGHGDTCSWIDIVGFLTS
jgi:hypothetical protein